MNPRGPRGPAGPLMDCPDLFEKLPVGLGSGRPGSRLPRVVPAGGDAQHAAHGGHAVRALGRPHELESLDGSEWGLPGEPGRGFSEDLPLFAEGRDLAAQAAPLFPLLGGQAVRATAVIAIGLLAPVPNRLGGRLELPPEFLWRAPRPRKLDEPGSERPWVSRPSLRHRGPPPPKGSGVHGSRVNSTSDQGRLFPPWHEQCTEALYGALCRPSGSDGAPCRPSGWRSRRRAASVAYLRSVCR